ncbi:MAG: nitronate monooxygenase [candidate division NC10 bacterium]|nr:nitronate monooxygenase [candidate division NC10 bacterium]
MTDRRPEPLRIGDLTASVPIIQGGMGVGVSLSGLASAVANEGGVGVIAYAGIGMLEADLFKNFLAANTRAIRNPFLDDVKAGKKMPFACPYHCIVTCDYTDSPYCIALALINAQRGRMDHGFAFAGANAHRATTIVSRLRQRVDRDAARRIPSGIGLIRAAPEAQEAARSP